MLSDTYISYLFVYRKYQIITSYFSEALKVRLPAVFMIRIG